MQVYTSRFIAAVVLMFIITLMGTSRAAPATREKRQNWVRTNEDDEWFVFDSAGGSSSIIAPPQPKQPRRRTTSRPTSSSTTETTLPPSPPQPTAKSQCEQECLATNEYNPVCTMENLTYANPGKLRCALMCGKRVTMKRFGRC